MPIIEFLKTSDNTYTEVSATNPLPTTATISAGSAVIGHVIVDSGTVTADTELPAAALLADGTTNPTTTSVSSLIMGFNGSAWDRQRNNTPNLLLASAARTVTTSSSDTTNYNARGLHVVLDVTIAGTGSITLSIEAKDTTSGKYYTLLAGVAVTTISTNVYKVYPGLPATANVSANDIVPRSYRVMVTANNANSMTYSVASLLVL